jgi:NTP pyrophosphatase (non-canonical NTP hydrolase)
MADDTTTVAALKDAVRRFAAARLWEPYHSPKNLVMALAIEAGELAEHFLWMDTEESRRVVQEPAAREAVADELADVACVVLNLSLNLGLDLSDAIATKMLKNERKYPADECAARERAKRGPSPG